MSQREKIVARPGQFSAGDVVQMLATGTLWEIVTTRVLDPGPTSDLKFKCRPAWVEEVPFEADRDHVVERELPRVEAEDPSASMVRRVEEILRRRAEESDGAIHDIAAVQEIAAVMGMVL